MSTAPTSDQPKDFADIRAEEVAEIKAQRQVRLDVEEDSDTVGSNLIGLAISGGGIRSATFGLGVLQELSRQKILRFVDLLSTVSGGGYIGSWFAANRMRQPAEIGDDFLKDDAAPVRHLRRYARYLSPRSGFLSADTWTAVSIWLRNTLSLQTLLLVFLMLVMLVPHLALSWFDWAALQEWPFFRIAYGCLGIAGVMALVCLLKPDRSTAIGLKLEVVIILLTLLSAYLIAPLIWAEVGRLDDDHKDLHGWSDVLLMAVVLAGGTVGVRLVCLDLDKFKAESSPKRVAHLVGSLAIQFAVIAIVGVLCGIGLFYFMDWLQDREQMRAAQQVFSKEASLLSLLSAVSGVSVGLDDTLSAAATQMKSMAGQGALKWAVIVGGPLVVLSYSLLIGAGISLSGSDIHDKHREWWARMGAWLFILSLGMLGLELLALKVPDWAARVLSKKDQLKAAAVWLVTSGIGVKLAKSSDTSGGKGGSRLKEKLLSLAPLFFFTGLMLTVACLTQLMVSKVTKHWDVIASKLSWLPGTLTSSSPWPALCLFVLLAVVLFILLSHFDINELSMNLFYRNRLTRCYLGASRKQDERKPAFFTGFDFDDDAELTKFQTARTPAYPGPFWIVNTALNTTKNPDLDVAERLAESFVLTPLNCGFERRGLGVGGGVAGRAAQGYRPTAEYMAGTMSAGAAVSVSGAAASPNSGYHTSPLIAFLLTIFNARLGWWSANPAKEKSWKDERPPFYKGMAWYVLKELFGGASIKDPFVYLSDGGHFENLGLYELVRRECRLIIVSDGEEDGDYSFHALGTAIRRCWVDFGARIKVDTSSISPTEPRGLCRGHCAIGKIRYRSGQKGTLIYLKSSWTGSEPTDLQQYRSSNACFPHESTGDQFFSESQFESYRKLGAHVTRTCLGPTIEYLQTSMPQLFPGNGAAVNVPEFINKLASNLQQYWVPVSKDGSEAFVRNTEMLVGIWKDVQSNPALVWMIPIVLPVAGIDFTQPSLPASDQPRTTDLAHQAAGRTLCQRLFQLMENVFIDLDLSRSSVTEDNSGWVNLFRHWARHGFVQEEWAITRDTFGKRFGAFWEQRLVPRVDRQPDRAEQTPV